MLSWKHKCFYQKTKAFVPRVTETEYKWVADSDKQSYIYIYIYIWEEKMGGEGASGTGGAGTRDWRAVRVKGFNLAVLGCRGAKLHSSLSPHRQPLWLTHLRLIKQTLSDAQASDAEEDFTSELLRSPRSLRFCSESFGRPHIPCPQRVKFSHHLTLEMVVGRVSTGWFIRLWTPTPLFFLHVQLDWWSVFLLLHVEPNLERVTGLSRAIPKRRNAAPLLTV